MRWTAACGLKVFLFFLTDLPLDIILFTDAHITDQRSSYINEQVEKARNAADEESLFKSVGEQIEKTTQKTIRISSLGFGSKVSITLIEGIARAGKGLCLAVQNGERLEKSVARMLGGALSPHYEDSILELKYEEDEDDDFEMVDKVTDGIENLSSSEVIEVPEEVTTSLSDPRVDPSDASLPEAHHLPQIMQAPHKIPSLFAEAETIVYLLMGPKTMQRNPKSVILRSPSHYGSPDLKIPIGILPEAGTTIHQLAARKAGQDLEDSLSWAFSDANEIADVQNLVEREAVRLGETFQVINKWCLFVAVSSNDGKEIFIRNTTFQPDLPAETPNRPRIFLPRPSNPQARDLFLPSPLQATSMGNSIRGARDDRPYPKIHARARFPARGQVIAKDTKVGSVSNPLATTPTAPQISPPNPNPAKVLALIDLQRFNGAWNSNSEKLLLNILGFKIPEPPSNGMSKEAWVTMLVIKFLEECIPEEKDVWGLVVEKAREYVRKCLASGGELHLLEEMAGVVAGKGKTEG